MFIKTLKKTFKFPFFDKQIKMHGKFQLYGKIYLIKLYSIFKNYEI
jgi:hypothetical protein